MANAERRPLPARLVYSGHSLRRMFTRSILPAHVEEAIGGGELIEDYPDDLPFPSMLLLAFVGSRPIHVVYAVDEANDTGVVVTVYEPDPNLWTTGFKERRS